MEILIIVLAAVLAVAAAAPGGLTGIVVDHGLGHIRAPQIISHAPVHHAVHVVHQPIAPIVHTAPIVTKTVLPSHGHGVLVNLGHGLHY
ncbi:hypothetical protein PV325_010144 [Microctonus aethiopoides]|nr:hypothetical protein PV325_010144 [Microctonus aethiopoides]KAK0091730.1 hypothetical protein PV326_002776 [Microctonus aethiopoides]